MSYPHTDYRRRERKRTLDRMVRQLNLGVHPGAINGDRDVLQAAIETVQRQCDVADDLPNSENYGRRRA